jgi:hypothetical protein
MSEIWAVHSSEISYLMTACVGTYNDKIKYNADILNRKAAMTKRSSKQSL